MLFSFIFKAFSDSPKDSQSDPTVFRCWYLQMQYFNTFKFFVPPVCNNISVLRCPNCSASLGIIKWVVFLWIHAVFFCLSNGNFELFGAIKFAYRLLLSLYLSLLPLLACTYLNNDWDLVLRELPLSDCLFKMNRFMYSPIVSRFG